MNKYKEIRKTIKDAKDKDLVAVLLVKKHHKRFVSEFVYPTDADEAVILLNALNTQFKFLKDRLEKEGVIENVQDAMYG